MTTTNPIDLFQSILELYKNLLTDRAKERAETEDFIGAGLDVARAEAIADIESLIDCYAKLNQATPKNNEEEVAWKVAEEDIPGPVVWLFEGKAFIANVVHRGDLYLPLPKGTSTQFSSLPRWYKTKERHVPSDELAYTPALETEGPGKPIFVFYKGYKIDLDEVFNGLSKVED